MSISVKLIFQLNTELELPKVAAGTIDPTPTLLGLTALLMDCCVHGKHIEGFIIFGPWLFEIGMSFKFHTEPLK